VGRGDGVALRGLMGVGAVGHMGVSEPERDDVGLSV